MSKKDTPSLITGIIVGIIVILAIAFFVINVFGVRNVFGSQEHRYEKVNICHATSSESNPYEAIRVDDDGNWHGHQDHDGDFLYNGLVDSHNRPTHDGDEWCEENSEEPTPTVEPTQEPEPTLTPEPTATPTPTLVEQRKTNEGTGTSDGRNDGLGCGSHDCSNQSGQPLAPASKAPK